jgi:DNA-binding CsgD family transcriptional regulator
VGVDPYSSGVIERVTLSLAGDVYGLLEISEFRHGLLSALREAIPAEWASLNEVGLADGQMFSIVEPALAERWHEAWAAYGLQNPLIERNARTRDGRPYRFSDVVSVEELHSLDLYRELYGPIGLEHQIAFTLPADSGQVLGVALSRRRRDFSDGERELLELVRPHLIQAYNNAVRHSRVLQALGDGVPPSFAAAPPPIEALRALGLTAREGEVLALAAAGRHDRQIAEILGISHRTAEKHLQRCYAKLGVRDRARAAKLVSTLAKSRPASGGAL